MTDGMIHVNPTIAVHAFSAKVSGSNQNGQNRGRVPRPSAVIAGRFQTLKDKLLPMIPCDGLPKFLPDRVNSMSSRSSLSSTIESSKSKGGFPTLCPYFELIRARNNRVVLVSEHRELTLEGAISAKPCPIRFDERTIIECAYDILRSLAYLHSRGIVVGNISLRSIVVDAYAPPPESSADASTSASSTTDSSEGGAVRKTWDPFGIKTAAQLAEEAAPRISVLLSDYALCFVTESGAQVPFALAEPSSLPPEAVLLGPREYVPTEAGDIWALGMIIVALLCGEPFCVGASDALEVINSILEICGFRQSSSQTAGKSTPKSPQECIDAFLSGSSPRSPFGMRQNWVRKSAEFQDFVRRCLTVDPRDRGTPAQLLRLPIFSTLRKVKPPFPTCHWSEFPALGCLQPTSSSSTTSSSAADGGNFCQEYQNWKAAGGDLELDLARELSLDCPLLAMPSVVRGYYNGLHESGGERPDLLYNPQPLNVSLDTLWELLTCRKNIGKEITAKHSSSIREVVTKNGVVFEQVSKNSSGSASSKSSGGLSSSLLALGERYHSMARDEMMLWGQSSDEEKAQDMEYLRHRVELFRELIEQYHNAINSGDPKIVKLARDEVFRQALADVPSVLRADVWAIVLGVDDRRCAQEYHEHLKGASTGIMAATLVQTEQQIEKDISRCHQYNQLLASSEGHAMFKRVLRAWLHANPRLVYWQGLDSVLAPFLALGFHEEKAFACLDSFVRTNLSNFYTQDNTDHVNRVLSTFRQLVAYYDPELSTHMSQINFLPSYYAIPWFLTDFSHVFSLDKVFPLWDRILLYPALPFFFAYELLESQREKLLTSDFAASVSLMGNSLSTLDVAPLLERSIRRMKVSPLVLSITTIGTSTEATGTSQEERSLWWHKPIPGKCRECENAPRMVLADFIVASEEAVVVDIRPTAQFEEAHYPKAINMPYTQQDMSLSVSACATSAANAALPSSTSVPPQQTSSGRFNLGSMMDFMKKKKAAPVMSSVAKRLQKVCQGQPVIIVGAGADDQELVAVLANELVVLGFRGVSTLNGGMECLFTEASPLLQYADADS